MSSAAPVVTASAGLELVAATLPSALEALDTSCSLSAPGGQAQFSTALSLQGTEDRFGALHSWMVGRLAEDLSLPALARKVGMSERSFTRGYVEATGSPGTRG